MTFSSVLNRDLLMENATILYFPLIFIFLLYVLTISYRSYSNPKFLSNFSINSKSSTSETQNIRKIEDYSNLTLEKPLQILFYSNVDQSDPSNLREMNLCSPKNFCIFTENVSLITSADAVIFDVFALHLIKKWPNHRKIGNKVVPYIFYTTESWHTMESMNEKFHFDSIEIPSRFSATRKLGQRTFPIGLFPKTMKNEKILSFQVQNLSRCQNHTFQLVFSSKIIIPQKLEIYPFRAKH